MLGHSHVQLSLRIGLPNGPQGWQCVNRVPEKAQVQNHHLLGFTSLFEKAGGPGQCRFVNFRMFLLVGIRIHCLESLESCAQSQFWFRPASSALITSARQISSSRPFARKSVLRSFVSSAAEMSCAAILHIVTLLNMARVRVPVLGLYRSGSTVVAGVLHHLGVDMGAPYFGGYYESDWLSKQLRIWWDEPRLQEKVPQTERVRVLAEWIQKREQAGARWVGMKHPLLSLCGEDLIKAWGEQTRFIRCCRPLPESVESMQRGLG